MPGGDFMIEEKFLELFKAVFDENGNIKPCGREVCAELIRLAEQVSKVSANLPNYYGVSDPDDSNFGYMKVSRIKTLHSIISNKF